MVPFVDREISAARSWIYQPETNARHPLASVRLKNDGETALPAGIITAFDRTGDGKTNFVGDAQLPLTGKGASKFVTFALDAKTDIRRIDHGVKQTRLGKAVDGQLTLTIKSRRSIDYEITPPAEEDRQIVIDEPRLDGWTPANPAGEIEQTAARLRYKVSAPKGSDDQGRAGAGAHRFAGDPADDARSQTLQTTLQGIDDPSPALKHALAKARQPDRRHQHRHRAQGQARRRDPADLRGSGPHAPKSRSRRARLGSGTALSRNAARRRRTG